MARDKLQPYKLVWSAELAYAVGLIATDGNLSGDGRHVVFCSKDIEQIKTFQRCLGDTNKIGITRAKGSERVCYRVQIGDVRLYRWLEGIGFFPRKTYSLGKVAVPSKFFCDFVRGHLDGDGTISVYLDTYCTRVDPSYVYWRLFTRFISASERHIVWLREMIYSQIGITGDLYRSKPRSPQHVSLSALKYMKKDSLKLFQWIYYSKNVACLSRKREKAEYGIECVAKKYIIKPF